MDLIYWSARSSSMILMLFFPSPIPERPLFESLLIFFLSKVKLMPDMLFKENHPNIKLNDSTLISSLH